MKKSFIIGISGTSGSGKSTFSHALERYFSDEKLKVIHMDDYYKSESELPKIRGVYDGKEYTDYNCPEALLFDRIYDDLQKAIDASYDVIVIEGLFALWDKKLYETSDLKIFIDCDADEKLTRRISRNLSYGYDLEDITSRYVQVVQPRQREYIEPTKWKADIILNGHSLSSVGCRMIADWVKANKPRIE